MSQGQLAAKVGVNRTYISHIETGEKLPSLPIFVRILIAIRMKPEDFFQRIRRLNAPVRDS